MTVIDVTFNHNIGPLSVWVDDDPDTEFLSVMVGSKIHRHIRLHEPFHTTEHNPVIVFPQVGTDHPTVAGPGFVWCGDHVELEFNVRMGEAA